MRTLVVVMLVACSSGGGGSAPGGIDKFAEQATPVATSANKLVTDIEDFKSGFHSPTALFKDDGPLVQIVTLFEALGTMKRIEGTGAAKACTDAWYGATDKLKGLVEGVAKSLVKLKSKSEDPSVSTLLALAAEWERKTDDFDAAVCALRTAAGKCVASLSAAKIEPGVFATLAASAKDCK